MKRNTRARKESSTRDSLVYCAERLGEVDVAVEPVLMALHFFVGATHSDRWRRSFIPYRSYRQAWRLGLWKLRFDRNNLIFHFHHKIKLFNVDVMVLWSPSSGRNTLPLYRRISKDNPNYHLDDLQLISFESTLPITTFNILIALSCTMGNRDMFFNIKTFLSHLLAKYFQFIKPFWESFPKKKNLL